MSKQRVFWMVLGPILYAALVPVVLVLALNGVSVIERTVGLHRIWRMGDVDIVLMILVFGLLLFPPAAWLMVRVERLVAPGSIDHFRQSGLVMAGAALIGFGLVAGIPGNDLAWMMFISVLLICLLGIIVNGLLLLAVRHNAN